MPIPISATDHMSLAEAKQLLEHPGLAAKLAGAVGAPIEKVFTLLPANWSGVVQSATHKALTTALEGALLTLDDQKSKTASNFFHKVVVGASGAVGGAFGLATLPLELPLTTTLMLRSIADIARSEGEDIRSMETRLACLEVFALGGPTSSDDRSHLGYFAVRAALARSVSEAAGLLAAKGLVEDAPAIIRLIATIGARFGVTVSEKVAAQALPLIGAVGGAVVNTLFMDHFQDMARGHFTVRRLERIYGQEPIEALYQALD